MGWFEKQIKQRKDLDQQLFEDSFFHAAAFIIGERTATKIGDDRIVTKQAVEEILKYYHFKPTEIPASVKDHEEQLDYSLRPHGIMKRRIDLKDGWYKNAFGPVLAYKKDGGEPAAILPGTVRGYYYVDGETGGQVRIGPKNAALFEREAYCFYKPLPQRRIGVSDLLAYIRNCISVSDVVYIVLLALAAVLVGKLVPHITQALTGPVLNGGNANMLIGVSVCLLCVAVSTQLIGSIRELILNRVQIKSGLAIQASMMIRILSLPASFFRQFSPGELLTRSFAVNQLCSLTLNILLSASLTSVMSLLYITDIFSIAPSLAGPSVLVILATVVFSLISSFVQMGLTKKVMEYDARETGMSYSMITGIQKIKLAGAEKRIFSKWLRLYADGAKYTYNPPAFIKVNAVLNTAISVGSTVLLYSVAVKNRVEPSAYYAFTAAYGTVTGAFTALSGIALSAAKVKPILDMAEPFLEAEPETTDGREIVTRLSGGIEMNNVCFRYGENLPYIVNDMSLKIKPGEYVALVGKTGCGKSTLMRLLLGFEKPEKGAIYYDGKDLNSLDLSSLRKKIGTVMQSGGLFQGDIYSNIVITAPELTPEDAWEAAEKAGIADDIRAMPMGMHTLISEGQGGISGGQKQRLLIARAIAPKPKILMFDEATSALDNKTQKQVSEALDAMGCTRIVIAQRLSTIRHCDRILVLDKGKVIEDGTYEELIAKGGFFAELVERQRLDTQSA